MGNLWTHDFPKDIVGEGETVYAFYLEGMYWGAFRFVGPSDVSLDHMDIGGAIEDTLHRMLDEHMSEDAIRYHLGAVREDSEDGVDWEENGGHYIDLGYVLPLPPAMFPFQ